MTMRNMMMMVMMVITMKMMMEETVLLKLMLLVRWSIEGNWGMMSHTGDSCIDARSTLLTVQTGVQHTRLDKLHTSTTLHIMHISLSTLPVHIETVQCTLSTLHSWHQTLRAPHFYTDTDFPVHHVQF